MYPYQLFHENWATVAWNHVVWLTTWWGIMGWDHVFCSSVEDKATDWLLRLAITFKNSSYPFIWCCGSSFVVTAPNWHGKSEAIAKFLDATNFDGPWISRIRANKFSELDLRPGISPALSFSYVDVVSQSAIEAQLKITTSRASWTTSIIRMWIHRLILITLVQTAE